MINNLATRQRFKESGRKIATWAKSRGLDQIRMHQVIAGRCKINTEELEALREDGLLVETEAE